MRILCQGSMHWKYHGIEHHAWSADELPGKFDYRMLLRPPDRSTGIPSTSGLTAASDWTLHGPIQTRRGLHVVSQAAHKDQQQQQLKNRRNAQLYELTDDDGWGVEVSVPSKPAATQQPKAPAKPTAAPAADAPAGRQRGTPYVDMRSQEGMLGLSLLQKVLLDQEEQQEQGQADPQSSPAAGIAAVKQNMQQSAKGGKKPKIPGFPTGSAAAAAAAVAALKQRQQMYDEEYEDKDEEPAGPEFQITFDNGKTEFTDFSSGSSSSSAAYIEQQEDLGMEGWSAFDGFEEQQEYEDGAYHQLSQPSSSPQKRKSSMIEEDHDALEASLIADMSHEDDWGLESLMNPATSSLRGRRSLLDELSQQEAAADGFEQGSLAADNSGSVQWGGSAGTTGIDLEEQEELLRRYFKPDQVKKLMKDQVEIDASYSEFRKRAVGLGIHDKKTQEKLRIISGTAAGKKLISFRSNQTRPMMEKVRQAIFNMIQAQAGTISSLPTTARWLDLFAGTGSVGLEALSRGVREAHLVEMDSVVVQKILSRNVASCGFKGRATCHTSKAEDFLRRANQLPRFAGGPFDFISVCPPYSLVSYPELYDLLDQSPLIHPGSIVFVEYPKQLSKQVRDKVGPLHKVKDRKYGRTYVAVYAGRSALEDEDEVDDPFLTGHF